MFAIRNILVLLSALAFVCLVAADTVVIPSTEQECKTCHDCRPPPKSMVTHLAVSDYRPNDYIEYSVSKTSPDKYLVHVDDIEGGRRSHIYLAVGSDVPNKVRVFKLSSGRIPLFLWLSGTNTRCEVTLDHPYDFKSTSDIQVIEFP